MSEPSLELPGQRRVLTVIDGAIALMIVLLLVQLGLLTATLEGFLAGHHQVAVPGTVASALLALGCGALYRLVVRADKSRSADASVPNQSSPSS